MNIYIIICWPPPDMSSAKINAGYKVMLLNLHIQTCGSTQERETSIKTLVQVVAFSYFFRDLGRIVPWESVFPVTIKL